MLDRAATLIGNALNGGEWNGLVDFLEFRLRRQRGIYDGLPMDMADIVLIAYLRILHLITDHTSKCFHFCAF